MTEYRMPSLGADMESGFLREWRVKPGDTIHKGDIIAEVETQKGIIEIEVFEDGIIGELLINVDEQVPVGTAMATILAEGEQAATPKPTETPEEQQVEAAPGKTTAPASKAIPVAGKKAAQPEHHLRASPLAKRIAAEKGLDISKVQGTGPEGAVVREDVEREIAAQAAPGARKEAEPKAALAAPQKEIPEKEPSEKPETAAASSTESIRQAVAAAMGKSNREIPHYYLETKVDMRPALDWLTAANKQRPVKERLLPAVLLLKAVAKALDEVPQLNAWWQDGVQLKNSINIGYVVALRNGGIMVPAIHDADTKTLDELMLSLNDLIPRARALRLRSSELTDATITVTSLGESGVESVFGVIYPPQVALVGFGGITEEPWAENGMLTVRPVLHITLAADHRATDGSTGSKFLTALKHHLQQPDTL